MARCTHAVTHVEKSCHYHGVTIIPHSDFMPGLLFEIQHKAQYAAGALQMKARTQICMRMSTTELHDKVCFSNKAKAAQPFASCLVDAKVRRNAPHNLILFATPWQLMYFTILLELIHCQLAKLTICCKTLHATRQIVRSANHIAQCN